jgi:hypothetical protein
MTYCGLSITWEPIAIDDPASHNFILEATEEEVVALAQEINGLNNMYRAEAHEASPMTIARLCESIDIFKEDEQEAE